MAEIKNKYDKYLIIIFSILSFSVPLIIYVLTLERKLVGGDTTWYALHLPVMQVMVPTGYPTFSIIGKLFSMIPIGDLAYRLNLISAIFGGLTILFLFLAVNKLVKNVFISFAGSLTFAFLFHYWTIANRLEFDTINSFFIALILFSLLLYTERPERKFLYFFAAVLGLSLTNHPIAFFILPAFVLYAILVRPGMFKSVKAVLLSILFFFIPLTLYAWIPIRSLQGYGPVTSIRSFLYYITGRNITGVVHGSTFDNFNIKSFIRAGRQFGEIIYENMGILLLLMALVGIIYLFKKNWKFALSSVVMIIFNVVITILYLGWFPANYTLNTQMVLSIYISMGFLFIYDRMIRIFDKALLRTPKGADAIPRVKGRLKPIFILKYFVAVILIICFMASPAILIAKNYDEADLSEPLEIYNFWNRIFDHMDDGSVIFVVSSSSNIGEFINLYERPEKKITFITHKDDEYNLESVDKYVREGKNIYFVNIEEELITEVNIEKIFGFYWDHMDEEIIFYDYAGEKKEVVLLNDFKQKDYSFGEKLKIEYRIINDNNSGLELTSIELELSDNIDLLGVDQQGDISLEPSMSRGIYMWVKTFPIEAKGEVNIIFDLQCSTPGPASIDFRVTSQAAYFNAGLIEFEILE